MPQLDKETLRHVLIAQQNEINEYHIYQRLALKQKDAGNQEVLLKIGEEEKKHYDYFKDKSGQELKPGKWMVGKYFWITRVLGLTFGLKLMERGEKNAQKSYQHLVGKLPDIEKVIADEENHEQELLGMIEEEKLNYVDSIVLGLNDALVELTGVLAGLSLALQNTRLIAVVGLVTGIAAALSMASSEYLSKKTEGTDNKPIKSAIYTGTAYLVTVAFLILPFLILPSYIMALGICLLTAILIILLFNYYTAVAKDLPFRKRFIEMAMISLVVSAISFGIGFLVRSVFGVDV
jgi:VIT1/CCC1 family predicted Fe2+/Mn2+ transporter